MAQIETIHPKRGEAHASGSPDQQKTALHVQRAAAAGALAAALLPLRAAHSAQAVAEAYEDAYNIMFPAKSAPAYIEWAKAKGVAAR